MGKRRRLLAARLAGHDRRQYSYSLDTSGSGNSSPQKMGLASSIRQVAMTADWSP